MPAPDAGNVVVATTGKVYTGPATPGNVPVSVAAAINAAYEELGFTSDDGVSRTDGKTVDGVPAWQSFYDIRKIVTGKNMTVGFTLREYNPDTVAFAFGGGAVHIVAGPPAYAVYAPPDPEDVDYRSLVVEYEDGGDTFRFVIPRGSVTGDVESNLQRQGPLDLPIQFEITPLGRPGTLSATPTAAELATLPWYEISNKGVFTTP